jgi:hypothetical protein
MLVSKRMATAIPEGSVALPPTTRRLGVFAVESCVGETVNG